MPVGGGPASVDAAIGGSAVTFDVFLRAAVACYFGFVAVHYTARLIGLRDRLGTRRAMVGRVASPNGIHQILFRVFRAAILLLMLARAIDPRVDVWLGAIAPLETPAVGAIGFAMMLISLYVVDYVHSWMADDWQSGTALGPGRQLLTTGPYALCRNPIFQAIGLGQLGLFLAAPSVFTAVCLLVGWVVLLRQVHVEEDLLARAFGTTYEAYRRAVPRWWAGPFRGRVLAGGDAARPPRL